MKRPRFSWKYAILITGVALLAYLVMDFNNRMAELRHLSVEKDRISAQVTSLDETQMVLNTQIAYATSEPAAVKWAYEDAHMARPGDNPVVPLPPETNTLSPTPTPAVEQSTVSNWQVWLWLFVDSGAPGGQQAGSP